MKRNRDFKLRWNFTFNAVQAFYWNREKWQFFYGFGISELRETKFKKKNLADVFHVLQNGNYCHDDNEDDNDNE